MLGSQRLLWEMRPSVGSNLPSSLWSEQGKAERAHGFPFLLLAASFFFLFNKLWPLCFAFSLFFYFFSPLLPFGLLIFNSLLSLPALLLSYSPHSLRNLQVYTKYSVKCIRHRLCLASELGLFWKLSGSKPMRYAAPRKKKARALRLRSLALHHVSDHRAQAGASPLPLSGQRSLAV